MILVGLIGSLVGGGMLAWFAERWGARWPRWIACAVLAVNLIGGLGLWLQQMHQAEVIEVSADGAWFAQLEWEWIPRFGISFHLGIDGMSLLLVLLSLFLGLLAVVASWTEIGEWVGFFHANLLWTLAGTVGVFLALDLFLFYCFWELMLVPMFLLIAIWGHENRVAAAIKFFLFTQASGLLMLVAILALAGIHYQHTGTLTFHYRELLDTPMSPSIAMWLMLGFFTAFAVKLPAVPFHPWLPDAHTEAPTAGSVILAGLLLKTGAYGMVRFLVPLFPEAAHTFAPVAMTLGVIGIVYGAVLAFAQTDLKRLVAYTSVSHLGFVLLGVFAWNQLALHGVLLQLICHGISTGALFILVGLLQERTHTRDMRRLGGLWAVVPQLGVGTVFFAVASLGLPGLGNFVAEFLILLGAFQRSAGLAGVATLGLVLATVYALWLIQATLYGPNSAGWRLADLSRRDLVSLGVMAVVLVWLGLYPQPVFETAQAVLTHLQYLTGGNV